MPARSRYLVLLLVAGAGGSAPAQAAPGHASVVAGGWHTCLLTAEGRVYCWGANSGSQLGLKSTDSCRGNRKANIPCARTPRAVESELRFTRLAAGERHTCGLTEPGEAWCWGSNSWEQLGTDSTGEECVDPSQQKRPVFPCSATPIRVHGGLLFASLVAGATRTCGLTVDGAAYCWGATGAARPEVPTPGATCSDQHLCTPMPVRIDAGPFVSLAAGASLTCGLQTEGTVWCWGDQTMTPTLVQTNSRFGVLALGFRWAAAVDNWGTTFWWKPPNGGDVEYGSLLGGPYTMLGVGAKHVCGHKGNGVVYCWGDDSDGRLGRGGVGWVDVAVDVLNVLSPDTTVQNDDRTKADPVATRIRFEQIAAGYDHTCGLSGDGRVFCWGDNVKGQLGSADATPADKPREIQAIRRDR